MPQPEREQNLADVFFETLAGRANGQAAGKAMREALQAEAKTIQGAENSSLKDLSKEELRAMEVIKQKLIADGVFRPQATGSELVEYSTAPKPVPSSITPQSMFDLMVKFIFGHSWQRPLAMVASVLMVSLVVLRGGMWAPQDDAPDVYRGAPKTVIVVPNPEATARQLTARLNEAGADAIAVQINTTEWSVSVELVDTSKLELVQQILGETGASAEGLPPYHLTISRK